MSFQCGMLSAKRGVAEIMLEQDIEKIKVIIEARNQRYASKDGSVQLAGVEGGTVKIAPSGFCWR